MKIVLISGSHRHPSQSLKVAHYLAARLQQPPLSVAAEVLSLAGNPLPLWDQGVWEGDPKWQGLLGPLKAQLRGADGFVVIAPEWHGQVPAGLKNLFLLAGQEELGHKPALIVAVSAGDGGAYPVAELRMSSYKNNRLCYIPEQLILRHVERVLNEDPAQNDAQSDEYYRGRIDWSLGILKEYAQALKAVRASGATQSAKFKNGM
jgi:NAD(P)H-dependent FMN reductase